MEVAEKDKLVVEVAAVVAKEMEVAVVEERLG